MDNQDRRSFLALCTSAVLAPLSVTVQEPTVEAPSADDDLLPEPEPLVPPLGREEVQQMSDGTTYTLRTISPESVGEAVGQTDRMRRESEKYLRDHRRRVSAGPRK